ncbi:hypothetical protein TKK_0016726 [Trichogramma kaykai]|uniref:ubiquitinyl hydrolase 1 n=1 Tax=Trichogramma kaykai TaxID=54128 RepID=A0ABD2W3H4_9HYME
MTILSKKKQPSQKDRRSDTSSSSDVDGVQSDLGSQSPISIPNSSYQVRAANGFAVDLHTVQADHSTNSIIHNNNVSYEANADCREESHFEEPISSGINKRHRRLSSPHRSCRVSRAKRERERDRVRGSSVDSTGELEREREHERQSTPPTTPSSSSTADDSPTSSLMALATAASDLEHEHEHEVNGYNSGDEYTGRTGPNLTLAEWQERDKWFEKRMKKRGFVIKKMGEDGACLFRAIADQVYGDQDMHSVVRKHCMDYLDANREFFSNFVAEDFSTYVDRKRLENVHGNHIEMQAMSEMYNRSIEVFCYSTEPINIFHGVHKTDNEPIRLSYQRGSHYNSIVDPYKATVGVGLGLPQYSPGAADRALVSDAVRQSEDLHIEQTMLEDKIKATDWEATNEAIEEQVARESYLQWLRDNEMRKARSTSASSTSTITSSQNSHFLGTSQRRHTSPPKSVCSSPDTTTKGSDGIRYNKRSPKHQIASAPLSTVNSSSVLQEPVPGSSKETNASNEIAFVNRLPPEVFGLTDWEDSDILSKVLATSQQEYLDSLKQSRASTNSADDSSKS